MPTLFFSHLSFTLHLVLFPIFFFFIPVLSGIALCLEPRLADARSNVFLLCTRIIHNSLSGSVVDFLFINSPSSSSPLSLHLFQPPPAWPSITGGLVWPMHTCSTVRRHTRAHIRVCLPLFVRTSVYFPFFHTAAPKPLPSPWQNSFHSFPLNLKLHPHPYLGEPQTLTLLLETFSAILILHFSFHPTWCFLNATRWISEQ